MSNLLVSALIYLSIALLVLFILRRLSGRRWGAARRSHILKFQEQRLLPAATLLPGILTPVLILASVISLTDEPFSFESQLSLYFFLFALLSGILFLLVSTRNGRARW